MNFAERLHVVREHFSLSQRKLSLELGLSGGAWALYESGGSLPGAAVLEALGRRGISLNWLLLGVGSMLLDTAKAQGHLDLPAYYEKNEQRVADTLGLGRLAMVASQSKLRQRLEVLRYVASQLPNSVSLQDIFAGVSLTPDSTAVFLQELLDAGKLVAVSEAGVTLYRSTAGAIGCVAEDPGDCDYLAMDAVQTIVGDVLPISSVDPSRGVLINATVYVKKGRGKEIIQKLVSHLQHTCEELHAPDGDVLKVVLGACM